MEYFDLYDENRFPLNKKIERGSLINNGEYRYIVNICILNDKNQMLIQQRQSNKKNWPNLWDISVGGCVVSGETSKQGAHRELFEELGINYDFSKTRPKFTINFKNGFDDIYILNMNVNLKDVKLQKEEVQNAKWATCEEILRMIDENKFIPYYKSYINMLFELKSQEGVIREQ